MISIVSNSSGPGLGFIMYIFKTLEFHTHTTDNECKCQIFISNSMALRLISDYLIAKAEGGLVKVSRAKPEGLLLNLQRFEGHLITNQP